MFNFHVLSNKKSETDFLPRLTYFYLLLNFIFFISARIPTFSTMEVLPSLSNLLAILLLAPMFQVPELLLPN